MHKCGLILLICLQVLLLNPSNEIFISVLEFPSYSFMEFQILCCSFPYFYLFFQYFPLNTLIELTLKLLSAGSNIWVISGSVSIGHFFCLGYGSHFPAFLHVFYLWLCIHLERISGHVWLEGVSILSCLCCCYVLSGDSGRKSDLWVLLGKSLSTLIPCPSGTDKSHALVEPHGWEFAGGCRLHLGLLESYYIIPAHPNFSQFS